MSGSREHAAPDSELPPDLREALRQVGSTGKAGLGATRDAAHALRALVSADLSLARSAFGRALAFTGAAVAFGGSAWLLLMATLAAVLRGMLGWSWMLSLAACAGLSLVLTALGVWQAMRYFEYTRMQATRRQLARLGLGELAEFMPSPGSRESARDAAEKVAKAAPADTKPDIGVDITPP